MCHEYTSRVWDRERADSEAEPESESADELPSFANEEGSDEVEVLTDGGDDES
jgi:hypothetical protein